MTTAVAAIMDAVFPTTTCSETMAAVLSGFCFSSPAAADVDAETTTMAAIPTAGSFIFFCSAAADGTTTAVDAATAITADAAADLFQSSQMFGQKKPRVRINRPGAFFHQNSLSAKPFRFPYFSFPLFHLFSFFFFSHTFQIYFIKGIPFEYLFSFCCFFSIHFPAVSFFFLPLIICFFPPSVIFSGLEHKIKRNKKTNAGMLPGRILI